MGQRRAYDAFETKPLRNAAIMVNFMRGRDRWSNEIRENLDRAGLLKPLWRTTLPEGEPELVVQDTTNRAFQFLMLHAWDPVLCDGNRRSARSWPAGNSRRDAYSRRRADRQGVQR